MVNIIWYWSLLNPDSISQTCEFTDFEIWYIIWYRRVFNKVWYNPKIDKLLLDEKKSHLNLEKFDDFKLLVSCFSVTEKEFEKLIIREKWYKTHEVTFYSKNLKDSKEAFCFIALDEYCPITNLQNLSSSFMPEERYMKICLESFSSEIIKNEFLNSTFLWDWKTTLSEYIF